MNQQYNTHTQTNCTNCTLTIAAEITEDTVTQSLNAKLFDEFCLELLGSILTMTKIDLPPDW